jgi:hypothetical protein
MKLLQNLGKWIKGKSEDKSVNLSEQELMKMLENLWQVGPDRAQFYRAYEGDFGRIEVLYKPTPTLSLKPKRRRK